MLHIIATILPQNGYAAGLLDSPAPGSYPWWRLVVYGMTIEIPLILLFTWDRRLGLKHKVFNTIPPTLPAYMLLMTLLPDTDLSSIAALRLATCALAAALLLGLQVAQVTGMIDRTRPR